MKVLYFASLKEALNLSSEDIVIDAGTTALQLRNKLIKKHGNKHFADNILCAVNQEIATDTTIINKNDEVAFYPPVTGG